MALQDKNILIFTITRSKDREPLFKWVGKFYHTVDYLWALNERKDISIRSLGDAKRYLIAVPKDDFQHQYIKKTGI